jgi:VanZ family protein
MRVIGTFLLVVVATLLAYNNLIPHQIKMIPYYDSIGHFVLFGSLAYFLDRALKGKKAKVFGLLLPMGSLIVACYAILDESLQLFSEARTFTLGDLSFGLMGIVTFYFIGDIFFGKK